MDRRTDGEILREIERKIKHLEENTAGKKFVVLVVALISGIFTISGVIFESLVAPRTEYGIEVARVAGTEAGKFYIGLASCIANADEIVRYFCSGTPSFESEEINVALEQLYEVVKSPPPAANRLIADLANAYNDFYAKNIGVGIAAEEKVKSDCETLNQLKISLVHAIDEEIRGSPF